MRISQPVPRFWSGRHGPALRGLLSGVLLAAAASTARAQEAVTISPDTAFGTWHSETHNGVVAITPCGASICGRLITSDKLQTDPDLRDQRNPQPSLRTRRLKGLMMLEGFHRVDNAWAGGTIYNPEDGHTYHARVTPLDATHLRVRGCVFVPLCKSQIWTRIN